jgi:hypothetical protein
MIAHLPRRNSARNEGRTSPIITAIFLPQVNFYPPDLPEIIPHYPKRRLVLHRITESSCQVLARSYFVDMKPRKRAGDLFASRTKHAGEQNSACAQTQLAAVI